MTTKTKKVIFITGAYIASFAIWRLATMYQFFFLWLLFLPISTLAVAKTIDFLDESFDLDIKDNQIAIAVLYGLFAISIAIFFK